MSKSPAPCNPWREMGQRIVIVSLWPVSDLLRTSWPGQVLAKDSVLGSEAGFTRFNSQLKLKGNFIPVGKMQSVSVALGTAGINTPQNGPTVMLCSPVQSCPSAIPSWNCPEKILQPSCLHTFWLNQISSPKDLTLCTSVLWITG